MDMRVLILPLILAAQGAWAAQEFVPTCPAPLEFTEEKAALLDELQNTHNRAAGQFLTRHLATLFTTAPNRRAQDLLNAGTDLRRQSDLGGALSALDSLVDYCPDYAEGYFQRGLARRAAGDFGGALDDLDAALARAPDHLGAMASKAQVLIDMGRYRDGEALRASVMDLNPWMPDGLLDFEIPGTPL